MSLATSAAPAVSLSRLYTAPGIIIGSAMAWISWVVSGTHEPALPERLISPMSMLFTLTAMVWFVMVVVRNVAVIRGHVSLRYFADYKSETPADDRLERPTRTFNNLMQVPTLFYVICILMLVAKEADNAQIILAWTFVALRCLHTLIYMILNWVPYRFAVWASSCITLGVIWYRFVAQTSFG